MADHKGRGFRIHFVEQGRGPAIVFVHGVLTDHTTFAPQFENLPDQYRCMAWDMRGHGDSEFPSPPWSLQDIVVDLMSFVEDTNAAPCHLVGASLGGVAALRLALQREELVRSLTLIGAPVQAVSGPTGETYRELIDLAVGDDITDELVIRSMRALYTDDYLASPDAVDAHTARMRRIRVQAVTETLSIMLRLKPSLDRLDQLRVPVLLVRGESDTVLDAGDAERMREAISEVQLVEVPAAGHLPHVEVPEAVNQALARFVTETL